VAAAQETDTKFDIRSDMIGAGPFVMTSYTPSLGFMFKRNPDYYDKTSRLVRVISHRAR
jgi:ABC-type oligopeptide transport system substrate-binding subunit